MARPPKYRVLLAEKDRIKLEAITSKGITSPRILKRAQILLKADQSLGCCLKNDQIAEMIEVSPSTVQNMRERYCRAALKCLYDEPRPGRPRMSDGEIEAKMIALDHSDPPKSQVLDRVRYISHQSVSKSLCDSTSTQNKRVTTLEKFEGLTDHEWVLIEPLIPYPWSATKHGQRPLHPRKILNTLIWVLTTGARWCDVPVGPQWASRACAHKYLGLWKENGVLERVFATLQQVCIDGKMIDLSRLLVDGFFVRKKRGDESVDYGYKEERRYRWKVERGIQG